MKIIITEEQKKKLFIPRKLSSDDSRYSDWNNSQPIKDGVRINQYDPEGRKTGYWEEYWDGSTKLYSKGKYKKGNQEGMWEYYENNGDLWIKGNYIDGEADGIWEDYWSNGNLENKGQYINGKMGGMWESYYRNGNLHTKGQYINDKKHGIWEYYEDNGRLEKKILYNHDRSVNHLPITESKKLFIPRKLSDNDSRYSEWNKQQPTITLDNHTFKLNQYDHNGNQIGLWLNKPEIINQNYIETKPFMENLFNNLNVVKTDRFTNYKLNDKIIFQNRNDDTLTYFNNDFWTSFETKYQVFHFETKDLIRVWMEIKYGLGHLYPHQVV